MRPSPLRTAAFATLAAVLVFGTWMAPQIFLSYMGGHLRDLLDFRFALVLCQLALIALAALLLRAPVIRLSMGPCSASGLRAVGWFTAGGVLLSFLVLYTITMSTPISEPNVPFSFTLQQWTSEFSVTGLAGHFAMFFVIGPAFEELLFRVLILGFLLRATTPWLALLITTILFAAVHSSWLYPAFAGFVYGLLYLRYQSFLLCLLAHAANNSVVSALPTLFVTYLVEEGFLVPIASNLWPIQITWFAVVLACFFLFFRTLFQPEGRRGEWFRMQPSFTRTSGNVLHGPSPDSGVQ